MKTSLNLKPENNKTIGIKSAFVFWCSAALAVAAWTTIGVNRYESELAINNQQLAANEKKFQRFKAVQKDLASKRRLLNNYDAILNASELAIDQRPVLTLLGTIGDSAKSNKVSVCITHFELQRKTHPMISKLNMGYRLSLTGRSKTPAGVEEFEARLRETERFASVNVESTTIENNNGEPFATFRVQCKY